MELNNQHDKMHKKNIRIKKQRFLHYEGSDSSLSSFLFIFDLRYEAMVNVGLARVCRRQVSS